MVSYLTRFYNIGRREQPNDVRDQLRDPAQRKLSLPRRRGSSLGDGVGVS
jgi:hypothetical protein